MCLKKEKKKKGTIAKEGPLMEGGLDEWTSQEKWTHIFFLVFLIDIIYLCVISLFHICGRHNRQGFG